MRVERWYDISCESCGRYLSTDFDAGMFRSRQRAILAARENGFKTEAGKNICPICIRKNKEKKASY